MPHNFIIAGYAGCPQLYQHQHAELLKNSVVLMRATENDPFQLYIHYPNLDWSPSVSQYIILRDLTINGACLFDWLASYHDDAETIFERFCTVFTQHSVVGGFTIPVYFAPPMSPSYATCKHVFNWQDYFAQDNFHEAKNRYKGGLHV